MAGLALWRLPDIESDCSDGELSDNDNSLRSGSYFLQWKEKSNSLQLIQAKDIDNSTDTNSDENDDVLQDFIGKDSSSWRKLSTFQTHRWRLKQQNVGKRQARCNCSCNKSRDRR